MKRATGSNPSLPTIGVSIQPALDGHSFSVREFVLPTEGPVTVEVLTPRTLLVPERLFDRQAAPAFLAAGGLALRDGECAACSDPQQGAVAVMALPAGALRQMRERFGERLRFTTPLLAEPALRQRSVLLHQAAGVLYIKVYDDTLRFAEAISAPTEADIVALTERLDAEFPLRGYRLFLAGEDTKQLRRSLGKRFKEVTCE